MSAPDVADLESRYTQDNSAFLLDSNHIITGRRTRASKAEKRSKAALGPRGKNPRSNADTRGNNTEHVIREQQPVPIRRRDPPNLKKALIVSRAFPRNEPEPKTPWWKTARAVVVHALLFAVLVALVRSILGLDGSRSGLNVDAQYAALHLENRVTEVEALLKTTVTATQVKLDSLVERAKRIEEKGFSLEEETKALSAKADDIGKYLVSLRENEFLTNDEFQILSEELKAERAGSERSRGSSLSIDDVRNLAREVIVKEIEKHAADGIGKVDYALASGGARVIKHSEPYAPWKAYSWFSVANGPTARHEHAQKMLQPSYGEPGQCFALKGSRGFVDIKLREAIIPDAVTLEHVAESVAYDRSNAPMECLVSGWYEGPGDASSSEGEKMVLLKEFSYDLGKASAQTFKIETTMPGLVNMIRLDILSNHGSFSHTCIYRFRVHGFHPGSVL